MNSVRATIAALLTVAASGAQATAATSPAASASAGSLFQVLLGLVAVLALMAGAAWLLKRFGLAKNAGSSTARIVGGVSVGSRERVIVVEVADQWIVVGVAPGRVNALATLPRQESAVTLEADAPPAKNFAAWLKQTIDKRNAG
jgi:flagellar protein FliO/FliZ